MVYASRELVAQHKFYVNPKARNMHKINCRHQPVVFHFQAFVFYR